MMKFSQSGIGGFSDDSEDLEVSRFSNLSGFRPINDIADDLSCDSDDCHPLLAQLNSEGNFIIFQGLSRQRENSLELEFFSDNNFQ